MKKKWSKEKPTPKSLIVCYYSNTKMLYWVNALGQICDAHLGVMAMESDWKRRALRKGYWEYVNYG